MQIPQRFCLRDTHLQVYMPFCLKALNWNLRLTFKVENDVLVGGPLENGYISNNQMHPFNCVLMNLLSCLLIPSCFNGQYDHLALMLLAFNKSFCPCFFNLLSMGCQLSFTSSMGYCQPLARNNFYFFNEKMTTHPNLTRKHSQTIKFDRLQIKHLKSNWLKTNQRVKPSKAIKRGTTQ